MLEGWGLAACGFFGRWTVERALLIVCALVDGVESRDGMLLTMKRGFSVWIISRLI